MEAKTETPGRNYWIRAEPSEGNTKGWNNGVNSAMLHYLDAPDFKEPPYGPPADSKRPLNETDLHPLEDPTPVSH